MSFPDEFNHPPYVGNPNPEPDEADVQRGDDQRAQDRQDRRHEVVPPELWGALDRELSRADEYLAEALRLAREGRAA